MKKVFVAFDMGNGRSLAAVHEAEINGAGELEHRIDGQLRATVPPEGWDDYAATWPDVQPVIDAARVMAAPVLTEFE